MKWSIPWRWRYGFSHYTTGRLWRLAELWQGFKARHETLARVGPHGRLPFHRQPEAEYFKNNYLSK